LAVWVFDGFTIACPFSPPLGRSHLPPLPLSSSLLVSDLSFCPTLPLLNLRSLRPRAY
jgi:hypothetical protein